MTKDIKSAVESFVKRVERQVEQIPPDKTSFEDSLEPNPLLRTDSDFRRGLAMNDPELRAILEDKDFDPSIDDNMRQAIDHISDNIRGSLKQLVLVLIEENRAFFSSDPRVAVDDVCKILLSLEKEITEEIEEYDRLVAAGEIKYRDDEQNYIWACLEEMKKDFPE
jgi:hypothetical protein